MSNVSLTEEDKIKLLIPYDPNKHYASSEPSLFPKRLTKLAGRKTQAEKLRQDALENLHIDPLTYTLNKGKKTVDHYFQCLQPLLLLNKLNKKYLKNKLGIKKFHYDLSILVRLQMKYEVFEYVYHRFYENNCQNFLDEVHSWLTFICEQNCSNPSLPVLDCEGNIHNDVTGCTVDILYNLPANQPKKCTKQQQQKINNQCPSHSTNTPQDLSTFPGSASGSDPPIPPHKSPTPNNSNSSS